MPSIIRAHIHGNKDLAFLPVFCMATFNCTGMHGAFFKGVSSLQGLLIYGFPVGLFLYGFCVTDSAC